MCDENERHLQADIQEALDTANQLTSEAHGPPLNPNDRLLTDTLTQANTCPLLRLRYGLVKCGLMAEKAPWQTLAALALTIGCGWLCGYFGFTVLACLILYAVFADE